MRRLLLLILVLLPSYIVFSGQGLLPVVHAQAGVSQVSLQPVSQGIGFTVDKTFNVLVRLNLTEGQSINAVDVVLNYTTYQGNAVLLPTNISYSTPSNIFPPGSSLNILSDCIDGVASGGTSCPSGEGIGTVHFAEVLIGNTLPGPATGTLFQVTFKIIGNGTSYFSVAANIVDPGVFPYPVSQFIPVVVSGGVFGNTGVVAFFNALPFSGPTLLPGQDVTFDASGSLTNSTGAHIAKYVWDFGDGSSLQSTTSNTMHPYDKPGSYPVVLNVTDSANKSGVWSNVVVVVPALGSLKLAAVDRQTDNPISAITVELFNDSQTQQPMTASLDSSGHAVFNGLVLGTYTLKVSGLLIESYSKTETIGIVGWPTQDTLYLTVIHPGPNVLGELIFVGSLIAGAGVVTIGIFARRRNLRKKAGRGSVGRRKTKSLLFHRKSFTRTGMMAGSLRAMVGRSSMD